MSAYVKTVWVNDTAPAVNDVNLNKIEQGIYDAHVEIDTKVTIPASLAAGEVAVWNGSAFARSSVTKIGLTSLTSEPRCRVRRVATQSLTSGSGSLISWDQEDEDSDTMFAATSTDITCKTAGVFFVNTQLVYAAGAVGNRCLAIRKNGTAFAVERSAANPTGTEPSHIGCSAFITLAVNDIITVFGYHTSSAALNVGGSDAGLGADTFLQLIRISA